MLALPGRLLLEPAPATAPLGPARAFSGSAAPRSAVDMIGDTAGRVGWGARLTERSAGGTGRHCKSGRLGIRAPPTCPAMARVGHSRAVVAAHPTGRALGGLTCPVPQAPSPR